jgi:hypothetical protein
VHHARSSDLNPRGQLFWTLIITAAVGLLALQSASSPQNDTFFHQTSLGGLPPSSLNAAPVSMLPEPDSGPAR